MELRGQNNPPQPARWPSTPPPHQRPAGTDLPPHNPPLENVCMKPPSCCPQPGRVDPAKRMPASALVGIHGRWDKGLSEWTSRAQKGEMERPRQPEALGHLAWPPRASLPREEEAAGGFDRSEPAFFRSSPKTLGRHLAHLTRMEPPLVRHINTPVFIPISKPLKHPLAPARVETAIQGSPRSTQGHAGGAFGGALCFLVMESQIRSPELS